MLCYFSFPDAQLSVHWFRLASPWKNGSGVRVLLVVCDSFSLFSENLNVSASLRVIMVNQIFDFLGEWRFIWIQCGIFMIREILCMMASSKLHIFFSSGNFDMELQYRFETLGNPCNIWWSRIRFWCEFPLILIMLFSHVGRLMWLFPQLLRICLVKYPPSLFALRNFIVSLDYCIIFIQTLMVAEDMTSEQRRESYLSDITYVTNSELGFDYLRDNLATESNSFSIYCFPMILQSLISFEILWFGSLMRKLIVLCGENRVLRSLCLGVSITV